MYRIRPCSTGAARPTPYLTSYRHRWTSTLWCARPFLEAGVYPSLARFSPACALSGNLDRNPLSERTRHFRAADALRRSPPLAMNGASSLRSQVIFVGVKLRVFVMPCDAFWAPCDASCDALRLS